MSVRRAGRAPDTLRQIAWLVVITIAIGACSGASPAAMAPSPILHQPSAAGPSVRSPQPSSEPTFSKLTATSKIATKAPAGSILMVMTLSGGGPRFQPDHVSVKAGTAVFFPQPGPNR